ncbi:MULTISPECIES: hypothetical protein [Novosphingobium]|nr:hypothetical protein [Novosphingobium sp. RL4]WRT93797.1 hypothetical protein U9J33_04580 [Novosphingobium sp. RL4]
MTGDAGMERPGEEIHIDKTDARAGSAPNVMRYVLLVSLALAIVALSAIWITGSVQAPESTGGDADTAAAVRDGEANPQDQPGAQAPDAPQSPPSR